MGDQESTNEVDKQAAAYDKQIEADANGMLGVVKHYV